MNGGFSRPLAIWLISVAITLANLAGCSVFRPLPEPVVEPAPVPAVPNDAAASAAAAMLASMAQTEAQPAQKANPPAPQKSRRRIFRRAVPKQPAIPATPAPSAPASIITVQLLPRDQARGLLGSEVQRPNGKVIGRAVDMLVGANGEPLEVIINLSGFMGVGDVKTHFPWSEFHFNPATRKTPATLTFSSGKTPVSIQTSVTQASAADVTPPSLQLLDNTVQDRNGVKVGRVVDILIDNKAQPQAIVFDVSNSIGPNRHKIAASWKAVRFVMKDKTLQLQMDLNDAQINAAPPYSLDQAARVIAPVAAPPADAPPVAASAPKPR